VKASTHRVGRVPRSSVVLIRSLEGGVPDAEILRRVREGISLKDYNINSVRFRDAVSGGVLLEVLDLDVTPDRVDALAGAIGSILSGHAGVVRPVRKAEFRLKGFDPSTTAEELREAVAKAGGCSVSTVSVSDIKRLNSGHRVAWVSCPATVARLLSVDKFLKVGWSTASMDLVHVKKIQCYRCWQFGHVRGVCKGATDRTGHCYRCGEAGHMAEKCTNNITCVLCNTMARTMPIEWDLGVAKVPVCFPHVGGGRSYQLRVRFNVFRFSL